MDIHIDWLSWTERVKVEPRDPHELYTIARQKMRELGTEHEQLLFGQMGYDPALSRTPYSLALAREDNGIKLYGRSHTGTILYELAGRACEGIRAEGHARLIVAGLVERLTRMDIAVDVRSDTRPADFANDRSHNAFRSVSFIRSDTGETAYVGSPKSDRFCRVYRYNEPHPRSALLRVEFVFRRKLASSAALALVGAADFATFVANLGNTWGWSHRDWQPGIETDERIRVPIMTKDNADTLRWLYAQVAPAMRRLLAEGALEMTDFLNYVYNEEGGEAVL